MNNHALEQYQAKQPAFNALELKKHQEFDLADDHWSDTEVAIIVVFAVIATVAVTRLLGKKKDAQHE